MNPFRFWDFEMFFFLQMGWTSQQNEMFMIILCRQDLLLPQLCLWNVTMCFIKASPWNLRETFHVANRWIHRVGFSRWDWMRSNRKSFLSIWHCRSLGMSCRLGCAVPDVPCLWEDVLNFLNGRHVEPKHKQRPSWKVTWHVKRRGVKTTGFYYGVPEMSLKDSI